VRAESAVTYQVWSSSKPGARRAAWEAYGGRLLLLRFRQRPHDVGHVASAYNRVDDIAWLVTEKKLDAKDDYSEHLREIQAGLYVVGRLAGYSDSELRARGLPVDDLRERVEVDRDHAAATRRTSR
jgi:hypothetical protein